MVVIPSGDHLEWQSLTVAVESGSSSVHGAAHGCASGQDPVHGYLSRRRQCACLEWPWHDTQSPRRRGHFQNGQILPRARHPPATWFPSGDGKSRVGGNLITCRRRDVHDAVAEAGATVVVTVEQSISSQRLCGALAATSKEVAMEFAGRQHRRDPHRPQARVVPGGSLVPTNATQGTHHGWHGDDWAAAQAAVQTTSWFNIDAYVGI